MTNLVKKIKPITLHTDDIHVILNNETGSLRQVLKPQPASSLTDEEINRLWTPSCHDTLYIRETWRVQSAHRFEANVRIEYKAGGPMSVIQFPGNRSDSGSRIEFDKFVSKWADNKWHSPISMPREVARLFLLAKRVYMARLKDITVEEIEKAGFQVEIPPVCKQQLDPNFPTPEQRAVFEHMTKEQQDEYIQNLARHTYIGWQDYTNRMFQAYATAWDRRFAPSDLPKYGWNANPRVLVTEYKRVDKEDDLQ